MTQQLGQMEISQSVKAYSASMAMSLLVPAWSETMISAVALVLS